MAKFIKIHENDNVAVALETIAQGETITVDDVTVTTVNEIPAGHKFALKDLPVGTPVVKYGFKIGNTTADVKAGEWIHTHNLKTGLGDLLDYSYEKPQPFYIGVPQENADGLHLEWDISYDFQGEDITYTVQLSDTYTFTTVLYEESNLHSPMITMPVQLEPGKYYIRVKATNESGREQYAFDTYMAEEGKQYGIKCFYYLEDGSIVEDGANDE